MPRTPRRLARALAALVLALPLSVWAAEEACAPPDPPAPRIERAVSLQRLSAELAACQPKGDCRPEALRWYGLTRIEGYVLDARGRDVLLFGSRDASAPALHVQDFVVAWRNALRLYVAEQGGRRVVSDPGVSIDPEPSVFAELQLLGERLGAAAGPAAEERALAAWCATCERPQRTRVMGIPRATRFAQVMVEADYRMKRLVDGSLEVDLPGFESLADRALRETTERLLHGAAGEPLAAMTRFWFYPGRTSYLDGEGAVLLERAEVVLRDEEERLAAAGGFVPAGQVNPLARRFSCLLSKRFPELAAASGFAIYAELEALFRWVALSRILLARDAFDAAGFRPDFLTRDFQVPEVAVPATLAGIASVKRWDYVTTDGRVRRELRVRLPSCGGVAIEMPPERLERAPDRTGRASGLAARIIAARPSPTAISWPIARR